MMKFAVTRGAETVRARITIDGGEHLWLSREYETEAVAIVVRDAIERGMNDRIEEIRRQAYSDGYRDGRSKRKKFTHFWQCINVDGTGC